MSKYLTGDKTMAGYRILVVEDEAPWQKILKRHIDTALQQLGVAGDVQIVSSLEAALDEMQSGDWNLLCTDIGLVKDSHKNEGSYLVGLAAEKGIPTIIVSGTPSVTTGHVRDFIKEEKVEDFFSKSTFNHRDFIGLVKEILSKLKPRPKPKSIEIFVTYNYQDKDVVIKFREELLKNSKEVVKFWMGEEKIDFGAPWMNVVNDVIKKVDIALVVIGPNNISHWQEVEVQTCMFERVSRNMRVIPVFLPGFGGKPEDELKLLVGLNWVDLRMGFCRENLDKLLLQISEKQVFQAK